MSVGRFLGGVMALVRELENGRYLLLQRSQLKDVGAGSWECVTGRVDQGENFEQALYREVTEEIGVRPRIEFIIGTTHFYRGPASPETELLGMAYACTIPSVEGVRLSAEHDAHHWLTGQEVADFLPQDHWLPPIIERAEVIRRAWPKELKEYFAQRPFDISEF
ncbi:MAG: NUDIX domain-containing protein [Ardenticatenaceae bacterium]|nr:NUDIX domain-containing protein [Anaerolineales bacterium]MCB8978552.1 NUDIX domain-containing protein [Ardenticatenaceae bacterium]